MQESTMALTSEEVMSATERIQKAFLERVQQVPGLLRVITFGGPTAADRSVMVYVPSLRGPEAREVSKVHMQCRREFPGSRLDVQVYGIRELGITADQVTERLPPGSEIIA
jgi:hypothetical protein